MKKIVAISAFALLIAATQPPVLNGTYKFETRGRDAATGRPICSETWTFDGNGGLRIESGEEVVDSTFRTEIDREGSWLVTRRIRTNGLPDCMGNRSDPGAKSDENRIYLMRFNNGTMFTCAPPEHTEDGTPLVSDASCYATLTAQ